MWDAAGEACTRQAPVTDETGSLQNTARAGTPEGAATAYRAPTSIGSTEPSTTRSM